MSVCERKYFLSNYCYIINIVVVVWGYPSLVGFSCGLRLSGETHLRRVCDTVAAGNDNVNFAYRWGGSNEDRHQELSQVTSCSEYRVSAAVYYSVTVFCVYNIRIH